MEIYELRYFLVAAKHEHVLKAASELHISPGSISKAIARLEAELCVELFHRSGRGIQLTPSGRKLQHRAAQIVQLEQACRAEITQESLILPVRIVGTETMLGGFASIMLAPLNRQNRRFVAHLDSVENDDETFKQLASGEAQVGIGTALPPKGMRQKRLGHTLSKTCVGPNHPLFGKAQAGADVSVHDVLQYDFVCPREGLLGAFQKERGTDGWNDRAFPRRAAYNATGLAVIIDLVRSGMALAYLPDFICKSYSLETLSVPDCNYVCRQDVRMYALAQAQPDWLSLLMNKRDEPIT
ncbi:MAG TPA: LysR family transcriptional regulator [Oligoflexus sp.]|nr:LysR family transcriptional regulator [Oligoflexus sp.]